MNTSEPDVSAMSPDTNERQAGECLLSLSPYRGETETTGGVLFALTLRALPHRLTAVQRLRGALKVLGRRYLLKAITVQEIQPQPKKEINETVSPDCALRHLRIVLDDR